MVSEEPHGGPDKGDGAPHWSYEGRIGPAYWGKLAREFALCDTGKNQSPVDIGKVFTAGGHKIKFNYKDVPLHVVNNGHTIQVNYPPGSTVTIDRKTFALLQFHFHLPSEHTVKGKPYEMEAHLVHKNEHGDLAVVAVFIRGGKDNGLLKKLWRHLPTEAGEERELEDVTINAKELLPRNRTHYVLSGSLTTPPCSEGVYWNVMKSPIRLSKGNIAKFGSIFSHNARPTQPLNNRLVVTMGGK
ncbi:MAG: carbonic anhydrase family protein [SAR324 cluster bacterium]|nr:carbonic anhydrase family protein [SAR324 cluster bacterium]